MSETTKVTADPVIGPEAIAKAYADIFAHEDRIIWQQITTLMGLAGVTIAAGFGVRGTWWAPTVVVFGAFFTILLYLFIHKVRLDREHASDVVNALWEGYADRKTKDLVRRINRDSMFHGSPTQESEIHLFQMVYLGGKHIVWRSNDSILPTVRAHTLVQLTCVLFLVVDCFLVGLFISEAGTPLNSLLARLSCR